MKKLIVSSWAGSGLDEDILARSLLQYRNTPSRRDGLSPAQKLFGHPLQDTLPAHRRSFAPEWQRGAEEVERRAVAHQDQVERTYNLHTRALPDIHVGSNVVVQNPCTKLWDIYGVVVEIGPYRRYHVKTSAGRILVRKRRFIRRRVSLSPVDSSQAALPAPADASPHQPHSPPADITEHSSPPPPPRRNPRRSCGHPCYLIEEISFT